MKNKLWFLTKMSLNKKIKTKWFYIANIIFLIIIVGLINIDTIIKAFGGDFNETTKILVIDHVSVIDNFKNNYINTSKYLSDYDNTEISLYHKSYEEALKEVEDDNKVLLVIEPDDINYLKAKIISKKELGTITSTLINTSLNNTRSKLILNKYNITDQMYSEINRNVEIESVVLNKDNVHDSLTVSSIMQVLTLPIFMLIMFLIQMIGAEVNEEKSTKSMEIIISNVSPKTHFMSKVLSSNAFVFIQGLLLISFAFIGLGLRLLISGGNLLGGIKLDGEIQSLVNSLPLDNIMNTLGMMIPILIVMLILTFIAYSLLAGILASMTTNQEDFQQLQTPIVVISLIGFYLSMMSGVFKGSLFIKIMSYIPLISSMLAPTLYVLGEITIYDLIISIVLLIGLIYLLIEYGLRIYKAGILNYSGVGLWKKMLKAIKEK